MKHNKRKFVKFTLWLVVIMITGFGVYNAKAAQVEYLTSEKIVEVDNLGKKIDQIKDEALEALKDCENAHYGEDDGIIIFDSNNKASIGEYQFQKDTVIHYEKILNGRDITRKESVLIALDTPKAKKLAHDVIFTTEKGYTNWKICSEKTGLQKTIEIVKKLEE